MVKQALYITFDKIPYVVEKPGTEVYRINPDGSQTPVTDKTRVSRILNRHSVISEAEALIMAYAGVSPDRPESGSEALESKMILEPGSLSSGVAGGKFIWKSLRNIRPSVVVTVGVSAILIIAAVSLKSDLGFFAKLLLALAVLPPIVYFLVFICVAVFLLYQLARFVIAKLQDE